MKIPLRICLFFIFSFAALWTWLALKSEDKSSEAQAAKGESGKARFEAHSTTGLTETRVDEQGPSASAHPTAQPPSVVALSGGGLAVQVEEPAAPATGQSTPETASPLVTDPSSDMAPLAAYLSQKMDLSTPQKRAEVVKEVQRLERQQMEATRLKAKKLGIPMVIDQPGGKRLVLAGFDGDRPRYLHDHNANSAISIGTHQVRSTAPFDLTGSGMKLGLWEVGGIPRLTHQEFGPTTRITVMDGTTTAADHATHVAGTILARGSLASALGMAPAASINAYDATNDNSEMIAAGAAAAGEAGKISISNHSYGFINGWYGTTWYGLFTDDGNPANDVEDGFGAYTSTSVAMDGLLYNLPYYLPFMSAGNDRNDTPPATGGTWYVYGSSTARTYDPAQHPAGDGAYKAAYDQLDVEKSCKNVITIGAANDAVSGGVRNVASGTLASFSSAGPTDDGRIKPDVVANGVSLTSSVSSSDTAYGSMSGTSMAAPSASGSALLLQQYYQQRFPGQAMRASTLKALLIHTADDVGRAGPDYEYGWGLMNTKAAADLIKAEADDLDRQQMTEATLTQGGSQTLSFNWDGVSPIRVTLCWADPAGTAYSAHDNRTKDLVNDLNLKVTGPDGSTTYLPFIMPYVGDWTNAKLTALATTGVNTVDNVEQVLISTPSQAGQYVVTVDHTGTLSGGSQAYSLIVSGGVWTKGLSVSPEEPLAATGHMGGPFTPSQKTYQITNEGTQSLTWNAVVNQTWVQVQPSEGTLAAGASTTVTVSMATVANELLRGAHEATVKFTQSLTSDEIVRDVSLTVTDDVPQIVVKNAADQTLNHGATVSFGNQPLAATGSSQTLKIGNEVLGSTLTVSNVLLDGPDVSAFVLATSPVEASISSSETQLLVVNFLPQKVGAHTARLRIYSNDPDESVFELALSAMGLAVSGPTQEIRVGAVHSQSSTAGPFTLPVVATSGLPVTYTVLSGPVTVDPSTGLVTPTGTGAVTIQVSQAGNGQYAAATPVTITFVITDAVPQFKRIVTAKNSFHTLAIDFQGNLWGWGQGASGQLGYAGTTNRNLPQISDSTSVWSEVSAGTIHSLGLKADGSLWAWGSNIFGQLGSGNTTSSFIPQLVASGRWISIAAGSNHSLAVREDGTLWAWGSNASGQVGDNSTTTRLSPVQIGTDTDWQSVSGGASSSVALKKTGQIWAWGLGSSGQLGRGSTSSSLVPVRTGSDSDWVAVTTGGNHCLALKRNGTLWGWGSNSQGQLGLGNTTNSTNPVQIGSDSDWCSISVAIFNSSAMKTDGSGWYWGYNGDGQIANGNRITQLTPLKITRTGEVWSKIEVGSANGYGLLPSGRVYAWGDGIGLTGKTTRQFTRATSSGSWVNMSLTQSHTLLTKNDGTLWGFGDSVNGKLGAGGTASQDLMQIGTATNWSKVLAGQSHSAGIRQDGSLWMWGYNNNSQIGDGTTTDRMTPVQIASANTWSEVAVGASFTTAMRSDGTLWAWGLNSNGQLGDGTSTTRTTPLQVSTQTTWSKIVAGSTHVLALKSDGSLWATGANSNGQLGVGDTTNRSGFTRVGTASDWAKICASSTCSFAVKNDGSLWAWGSNSSGQLGLGDFTNRTVPTRVGTGQDWVQVACGANWTAAIKTDGTLWAWGNNASYQQGINNSDTVSTPRQIGNTSGWVAVQAGVSSILVRRADGSLWTAGFSGSFRQTSGGGRSPLAIAPVLPGLQPQSILPLAPGFHSGRILASSGLPVQLEIISGSGTVNGDVFTHTGAVGTKTVVMAWQRGDETAWDAALPTQFSITTQAIDFPAIAQQTCGTPFTLNATASSDLPVSYSITAGADIASLQNGVLSFTGAGEVTVQATQAGGSGYAAAEPVSRTFTVVRASQALTFTESVPASVSYTSTVTLAATSDRGLAPITFSMVSGPGLVSANELSFTAPGTVVVKASQAGTAIYLPAEAEITIEAINDAPVAQAASASGDEDTAINGQVQATDAQNTPLTYAVVTGPQHGELTWNANGSYSYLPDANYHGADSFTFKANDGLADSEPAIISLSIASVNDAPVALAASLTTPDSVPLDLVLTGQDVEDDGLTFSIVTPPQHGTLTGALPNMTYISDAGYAGADAFTFVVHDGTVASAAATVSIQVSPVGITFVSQPQSQKVSETERVTLRVEVKGTNPISYRWMKDDQELEGETEAELVLDSPVEADSGVYHVEVTNPVETVDSQSATVQIIGDLPEITEQPAHRLALVGEDVVLRVKALGKPPLSYQWYKNGKVIRNATTAELRLPSAQLTDAGAYKVIVTATSSTTSDDTQVGVAENPGKQIFVAEGGKTSWSFKTAGNDLTHLWQHEGEPLPNQVLVSPDGKKVSFTEVTTDDAGDYVCVVSGPGGELTAGAHTLWVVDEPPDITPLKTGDSLPRTIVGEDYEYEVPFDEDPQRAPSLFSASGLPPGLTIDSTTGVISGRVSGSKSVAYAIKITASNNQGSDAVSVSLLVEAFPAIGTFVAPLPRHAFNDELGGRLDVVTTASGGFSGKLTLGSRKVIPFKGGLFAASLDADEPPTAMLVVPQPAPLPPLELEITLAPDEDGLEGSLSDGAEELEFEGWRNVWNAKSRPAGAWDGLYNVGLIPETRGDGLPEGTGFTALTVAVSGTVKVAGKTADGELLSSAVFLGPQGQVHLHQLLYKTTPKGSLTGIVSLGLGDDDEEDADNTVAGALSWSRPASTSRVYPEGFPLLNLTPKGQRYLPPLSPKIVLGLADEPGNAALGFTGAGIEQAATPPDLTFQITDKHKLLLGKAGTEANPGKVTLKLNAKTGLFSGSLTLTDPGPEGTTRPVQRKATFEGLIYDDGLGASGQGYFLLPQLQESAAESVKLTPILSGAVELQAP